MSCIMARKLWVGSCTTPHPKMYGESAQNPPKSKFLKPLHASFFDFPLASKIIVRNLSYSTTESCLQKEFSSFGEIAEVDLVKDKFRKRSKGFAFIQYSSQEAALQALENMDQKYVDGRLVYVELAKPGGKHLYGVLPKTSGPPEHQNLLVQDEEEQ